MSDTKESMPAQPQTREMEAVKVPSTQLEAVLLEVRATREEQRAGREDVADKFVEVSTRMSKMEHRIDDLERRQEGNSIRAKEPSQHDIELKKELDEERKAREALAEDVTTIKTKMQENTDATLAIKQEVVDGVKSFWKRHPKLETALVGLILAAIGVAYATLTHGGQLP